MEINCIIRELRRMVFIMWLWMEATLRPHLIWHAKDISWVVSLRRKCLRHTTLGKWVILSLLIWANLVISHIEALRMIRGCEFGIKSLLLVLMLLREATLGRALIGLIALLFLG